MRRLLLGGLLGGLLAVLTVVFPAAAQASAWDKPALTNPVRVDLSATAATVYNDSYRMSPGQDYVFTCPTNPVVMPHWLEFIGGHNIVVEHCVFQSNTRALKLQGQTGTAWIHDVHFEAAAGQQLTEGIDLQEPDVTTTNADGTTTTTHATVVLRDVLIDEVHGSQATNHADLIQDWSGPWRLLIDAFTGLTDYQGFFLLPNQHDNATRVQQFDFRNIDVTSVGGAYDYWIGDQFGPFPLNLQSVYGCGAGEPRTYGWTQANDNPPGAGDNPAWSAVSACPTPSGGHYVWATADGAYGVDDPTPLTVLAGEQ